MDEQNMFYLVYWLDEKTTSVLSEKSIERKTVGGKVKEIVEGDVVAAKWNRTKFAAKVLRFSRDAEYLDSLHVSKETGEVLQGNEKPHADILALKKQLQKVKNNSLNVKKDVSRSLIQDFPPVENRSSDSGIGIENKSKCNGACDTCCKEIPFRHLLPKLTPTVIDALASILHFVSAVQPLKESCDTADSDVGFSALASTSTSASKTSKGIFHWQIGGFQKEELGQKGSGVWLDSEALYHARSVTRSYKKFGDKALFRTLLTHTLGTDELTRRAKSHEAATTIDNKLLKAIEQTVNAEYHSKMPMGRSYYLRVVNSMLCHLRGGKPKEENEGVIQEEEKSIAPQSLGKSSAEADIIPPPKKKKSSESSHQEGKSACEGEDKNRKVSKPRKSCKDHTEKKMQANRGPQTSRKEEKAKACLNSQTDWHVNSSENFNFTSDCSSDPASVTYNQNHSHPTAAQYAESYSTNSVAALQESGINHELAPYQSHAKSVSSIHCDDSQKNIMNLSLQMNSNSTSCASGSSPKTGNINALHQLIPQSEELRSALLTMLLNSPGSNMQQPYYQPHQMSPGNHCGGGASGSFSPNNSSSISQFGEPLSSSANILATTFTP